MNNQKSVEATSEGKNRVYLGKDGIIYVNVNNVLTEKDIKDFMRELEEMLCLNPGKLKILINMDTYPIDSLLLSPGRKMIAEEIKRISKDPGYKKTAMFGGNLVIRTTASFIVAASELDNIKVFSGRDKAIKWLKEP